MKLIAVWETKKGTLHKVKADAEMAEREAVFQKEVEAMLDVLGEEHDHPLDAGELAAFLADKRVQKRLVKLYAKTCSH